MQDRMKKVGRWSFLHVFSFQPNEEVLGEVLFFGKAPTNPWVHSMILSQWVPSYAWPENLESSSKTGRSVPINQQDQQVLACRNPSQ